MSFYFWPTAVPAADIDWARYPEVGFLKNVDAAGNAFPSLHVATAIFSGIWLDHLLRRFGAPLWSRLFNWMWCIGIIYSTLATRQHVAVDVWAGLVLGGVAAWLSLRHRAYAALDTRPDLKETGLWNLLDIPHYIWIGLLVEFALAFPLHRDQLPRSRP